MSSLPPGAKSQEPACEKAGAYGLFYLTFSTSGHFRAKEETNPICSQAPKRSSRGQAQGRREGGKEETRSLDRASSCTHRPGSHLRRDTGSGRRSPSNPAMPVTHTGLCQDGACGCRLGLCGPWHGSPGSSPARLQITHLSTMGMVPRSVGLGRTVAGLVSKFPSITAIELQHGPPRPRLSRVWGGPPSSCPSGSTQSPSPVPVSTSAWVPGLNSLPPKLKCQEWGRQKAGRLIFLLRLNSKPPYF